MHPENAPKPEEFCCKLREFFLVGIVACRSDVPTPVEAADFVDFEKKTPDGKTIINLRFCPFCGKKPTGPLRVL